MRPRQVRGHRVAAPAGSPGDQGGRASAQRTFDVSSPPSGMVAGPAVLGRQGPRPRGHVERRRGGRVYETLGRRHRGRLGHGDRLGSARAPRDDVERTPAATEVEFTFVPVGPALTRVAVEHRGWEALSEAQLGRGLRPPRRLQPAARTRLAGHDPRLPGQRDRRGRVGGPLTYVRATRPAARRRMDPAESAMQQKGRGMNRKPMEARQRGSVNEQRHRGQQRAIASPV